MGTGALIDYRVSFQRCSTTWTAACLHPFGLSLRRLWLGCCTDCASGALWAMCGVHRSYMLAILAMLMGTMQPLCSSCRLSRGTKRADVQVTLFGLPPICRTTPSQACRSQRSSSRRRLGPRLKAESSMWYVWSMSSPLSSPADRAYPAIQQVFDISGQSVISNLIPSAPGAAADRCGRKLTMQCALLCCFRRLWAGEALLGSLSAVLRLISPSCFAVLRSHHSFESFRKAADLQAA